MKIFTAPNGKKIITLESWEEPGIKIIVPKPKAPEGPDDITANLQKIPLEIAMKMDDPEEDELGLGMLAKMRLEPVWCPHGKPDSIDMVLECDTPAIHFSYLVFPFDISDEPSCEKDDED